MNPPAAARRLNPTSVARALLWALALGGLPGRSQGDEGPDYRVARSLQSIELRRYAPYAVAEVRVPGPAADAANQGFPILSAYLLGGNRGERRLAMTAPVLVVAAPATRETAPGFVPGAPPAGFVVQFLLPRGLTRDSAPQPLDDRVRLRHVPAHRMAVVRYSGFWSAANDGRHLAMLQSTLRAADLAWTGEAIVARYDAPFVPWFLRRNEIWLRVPG